MGNLTYKDAGVDTKEGERAVSLMKKHVKRTLNENVLSGLGSFGGLFKLPIKDMEEPVLVSGTDGVGTKLRLAFMMDKHDTVGIDAVAMCVNDILCQGAKPLFFLDYIATGKVTAENIESIVAGIAEGCVQGKSALIGGETAEMPGFYGEGEYDIAGFSVGIVDKKNIITGDKIKAGDVIIGISSSGIHSNGYSLVRKVFFEKMNYSLDQHFDELGETLGEALLRPTKIYANACEAVVGKYPINGIVHITGGGFYENIPRVLPEDISVEINKGTWNMPPIFDFVRKNGDILEDDMYNTFNMGVGMMMFVDKEVANEMVKELNDAGETAYIIGKAVCNERNKVILNE